MTSFFAAITGRDYIKTLNGEVIPFWELLDNQPDGWLTSITNIKRDIPKSAKRIFDCGAWTYRESDVPELKGELVTPEWAYAKYKQHCLPGDILIAPDHMIIPGCDKSKRIEINRSNAERFIKICEPEYNPMVCVHGDDARERVDFYLMAREMGYKHFAIGGLAAQARKKDYCKKQVKELMAIKRDDEYIHVLGLSAKAYSDTWAEIGVSSFDGASHYLRAMTAGYFYTADGGYMIASKSMSDGTSIPQCECKACSTVRKNGGDTRFYGNSLNNIGRAAHNLNIMIKIYKDR